MALSSLSPLPIFSESVEEPYEALCNNLQIGMNSIRFIVVYIQTAMTPSCSNEKTNQLVNVVSTHLQSPLHTNVRFQFSRDCMEPKPECQTVKL